MASAPTKDSTHTGIPDELVADAFPMRWTAPADTLGAATTNQRVQPVAPMQPLRQASYGGSAPINDASQLEIDSDGDEPAPKRCAHVAPFPAGVMHHPGKEPMPSQAVAPMQPLPAQALNGGSAPINDASQLEIEEFELPPRRPRAHPPGPGVAGPAGPAGAIHNQAAAFAESPGWQQLLLRGMDEEERQTLHDLRAWASLGTDGRPPPAPVRSRKLYCVIVKLDGDRGEDLAATLQDDTGKFEATLQEELRDAHPGCVAVGASWALERVGVLTLAPHSHHLLVHPSNILFAMPPKLSHGPTTEVRGQTTEGR